MKTIGKETSPKNSEVRWFETRTHELNLTEGPPTNIGLHFMAISLRTATRRKDTVVLRVEIERECCTRDEKSCIDSGGRERGKNIGFLLVGLLCVPNTTRSETLRCYWLSLTQHEASVTTRNAWDGFKRRTDCPLI
jgi:hypothetical protein